MKPELAPELRKVARYYLRLPVQLSYEPAGSRKTFFATTRDISIAGLFVVSAENLPVHTQVDVSVKLESAMAEAPIQLTAPIQLMGSGKVVRQSEGTEEVGFAIAVRLNWPN